ETSKRRGIENHQDREFSSFDRNWARLLPKMHPNAILRTNPCALYNCHGLVFASRRTKIIATNQIKAILEDDRYEEVEMRDVKPGDIVIYSSEIGDANHSGVVVEYRPAYAAPIICSTWGNAAAL